MAGKNDQSQTSESSENAYEKQRALNIEQNKKVLESYGVGRLVKSVKGKQVKGKNKLDKRASKTARHDEDFVPDDTLDGCSEEDFDEADATTVKVSKKKKGPKCIAPLSLANNLAKKRVSTSPSLSNYSKKSKVTGTVSAKRRIPEECKKYSNIGVQSKEKKSSKPNKATTRVTNNAIRIGEQNVGSHKDVRNINEKRTYPYEHEFNSESEEDQGEEYLVNDGNYRYEDHEYQQNDSHEELSDPSEDDDEDQEREQQEDDEVLIDEDERGQNENEIEEQEIEEQEIEAGSTRKKTRGPSSMKHVWDRKPGDQVTIFVNEYGQPINSKSSELSHFLGAISRSGKYCPLYKPWYKVKKAEKDEILQVIKEKYDIRGDADSWILKSVGRKVKNWRERLKKNHYDPTLSRRANIDAMPEEVHLKHWKKLLKLWESEDHLKLSQKNKINQANKTMVPLTGKKSFAKVREELKTTLGRDPSRVELFIQCYSKNGTAKNAEVAAAIGKMEDLRSKLPDGSVDTPAPDDVYSKVRTKDKKNRGQVDMFGLGVRESDLWGDNKSKEAYRREIAMLNAKIEKYEGRTEVDKGSKHDYDVQAPTSNQNAVLTKTPGRPKVGSQVLVKSVLDPSKVVAKGWLRSVNPRESVGNTDIGSNWCKVDIQVPIIMEENLIRPYADFKTIGECIGAPVAWPISLISEVLMD